VFLPLRDALPTRHLPYVTLLLVAVNVVVFLAGLAPSDRQVEGSTRQISKHDVWLAEYGAIPCEISGRCANQDAVVVVDGGIFDPQPRQLSAQVDQHPPALTLVTSMFLHGGFLHLLFNLLFLWVFGNNVEDSMHPLAFLGFYLVAGMLAGLAQVAVAASAAVPTVGASGAIAAVIGAYPDLHDGAVPDLPVAARVARGGRLGAAPVPRHVAERLRARGTRRRRGVHGALRRLRGRARHRLVLRRPAQHALPRAVSLSAVPAVGRPTAQREKVATIGSWSE
jgi:membrane associated rhomboid family serine protease